MKDSIVIGWDGLKKIETKSRDRTAMRRFRKRLDDFVLRYKKMKKILEDTILFYGY